MKASEALATPVVTDVMVGAPGGACGVPVLGSDSGPTPIALTARSRTEYVVPLVRPVMVSGEVAVPADTQRPLSFSWYS